jgi:hypothetical protein
MNTSKAKNGVKSLLLGTAAGLAAIAGPQAADMPVKAAPVQYVKICSLYGDGFYYIAGTNTCLKIGGYVRMQPEFNAGAGAIGFGDGANTLADARFTRFDTTEINYTMRMNISLDAREQTEYGTLRSYARFGFNQTAPNVTGAGTTPTNIFAANSTGAYWERAFIQFAGFTFGRVESLFDIFTYNGTMSYLNPRTSGDTYFPTGVSAWAYTAAFGDGWSATLSAEDPNGHNKAGIVNNAVGPSQACTVVGTACLGETGFFGYPVATATDNGFNSQGWGGNTTIAALAGANIQAQNNGFRFPDAIFNLRVDQAWGFAGASLVIHDDSGAYYTGFNCGLGAGQCVNMGHPSDKIGWAAAIGGLVNLPGGDTAGVNFVATEGAIGYAQSANNWNIYNNSNRVGAAWAADGIYTTFGEIELTQAWSVNAAYQHLWNRHWRTSFYGGFVAVHYNDNAKFMINSALPAASPCNPVAGGVAGISGNFTGWTPLAGNTCSSDYSFYQIGSRTQWNPVANLDIGLDVFYTHLNTAYKGPVNFAAAGARPACANVATMSCAADDQNVWSGIARIQRNFYP